MLSYPKEKMKIVLLEGVHPSTQDVFAQSGYTHIQNLDHALEDQKLIEHVQGAHLIGIRSRTQLSASVLSACPQLLAVGCYCIGTNQVDLHSAARLGIPVFNSPHSNTRSVAELVIGWTVMLFRQIFSKNAAAHVGKWEKTASHSHEVRGKTLGIIGYGHIGSQVSILAEAMGMRVVYFDTQPKLPLGNAQPMRSLNALLAISDLVTLHVPEDSSTQNMMNEESLRNMKAGSYLVNASRGNVVDLEALKNHLDSGHLAGAALDVFPNEPEHLGQAFSSILQNHPKVILTPHIGGSTEEAQANIGQELALKLVNFCDLGSSQGAVNFPEISLTPQKQHRVLHVHRNIPGMLQEINTSIAQENINIVGQHLVTKDEIGYVIFDLSHSLSKKAMQSLKQIEGTIRTRILH